MNGWNFGSPRQMIDHDLNEPYPSDISAQQAYYRFGSDCIWHQTDLVAAPRNVCSLRQSRSG